MAPNNRDGDRSRKRVVSENLSDESRSTDDIQCSNTKDLFCVKNAVFFEYLRNYGHSRVNRIGDDEDKRLGSRYSDSGRKITDDPGINLEQVISCHTGFPWYTSRDHNNVGTSEDLLEPIVRGQIPFDFGGCSDMRQIGGNARGINDIEQAKLRDHWVAFEQQRQWLANTT